MRFLALSSLLAILTITGTVIADDRGIVHNGDATYYDQQGAYGSCGHIHAETDLIVAISTHAAPSNAHCGRNVSISLRDPKIARPGARKMVEAKVADTCMGCGAESLDLSRGAFMALTGGVLDPPGRMGIKWHFV